MADKTSEFPTAGALDGTELVAVVQGGADKKSLLSVIKTFVLSTLGTMATQAASGVAITGGSIAGITDLAVADGGTGASSASAARSNLGLGTIATLAAPAGTVVGTTDTQNLSGKTFVDQVLHSLAANNATSVPIALRNGGTSSGANAVAIDFDPGGNGVGVRAARILATNSGSNTISLAMQISSGGALATAFNLAPTGAMRLNFYGAGTLVTDASGNVTASSDARLKTVERDFSRGLSDLLAMAGPILFRWNEASELDTEGLNVGWLAQDVQKAIPEAVGVDPNGMLTLSDRAILAATVNALREVSERLARLEA